MQKKVLALAVAGLVSGAAFAQTAVTFGGSIATDFSYSSDYAVDGVKAKTSIDDSNWQASRLWWLVQEDLGNGLKVEARQELRIHTDRRDTGVRNQRSYLQIGGSWGAIKMVGGHGNVLDNMLDYSEAKSADWGKGVINPLIAGHAATNDTLYNTVQYLSPNYSGFTVKLSASGNDKNADEANGNGDVNVRSFGFNASYVNGPIKVGLAHLRKAMNSDTLKETLLSGMYDFGMFQLGAAYAASRSDQLASWNVYNDLGAVAGTDSEWSKKAFRLNLGVDVTPKDHIGLSYSQAKVNFSNMDDEKMRGIGLSYTHALSKRTTFLAEYADWKMGDSDRQLLASQYMKQLRVGMRHDF